MRTEIDSKRETAEGYDFLDGAAERLSSPPQGQRMRIAFFLPELAVGGAERVFLTLAGQLARRGHDVELWLARKNGALLPEIPENVRVVCLTSCGPQAPTWRLGLYSLFGLSRQLRRHPPDALFSTLTGANLVAILARKFSRSRTRLFIREATTLANVQSRTRLWLMRLLYPHADEIIVLTAFMKHQMRERLHLKDRNFCVIGNPVDEQRTHRLSREDPLDQARKIQPYIVAVGRLAPPKDLVTIINALSHLRETDLSIDLVIVGDGPLREALQNHARSLGLERHVHFVGQQTNPYAWMAAANVFVLSSLWEGYPNALFEAVCLGKPVVVTEYDDSVNALLAPIPHSTIVPVGDAQEMSIAIRRQLHGGPTRTERKTVTAMDDAVDAYESLAATLHEQVHRDA